MNSDKIDSRLECRQLGRHMALQPVECDNPRPKHGEQGGRPARTGRCRWVRISARRFVVGNECGAMAAGVRSISCYGTSTPTCIIGRRMGSWAYRRADACACRRPSSKRKNKGTRDERCEEMARTCREQTQKAKVGTVTVQLGLFHDAKPAQPLHSTSKSPSPCLPFSATNRIPESSKVTIIRHRSVETKNRTRIFVAAGTEMKSMLEKILPNSQSVNQSGYTPSQKTTKMIIC
jgi:hypothetical protein